MPPRRPKPGKQRNGSLWLALLLGGVLALGLVAAALLLESGGSSEPQPATSVPVTSLAGISQRGTELGSPGAKVTLIEYADLACPYCARYATDVFPTIVKRYVRPGKVKLEFRGLAFLHPVDNSDRALRYVHAAGEQGKLWDYLEHVFASQGEEGTGWFTDGFGRSVAKRIPGLDVDQLVADAESAKAAAAIAGAERQASAHGISGTPSFFVAIGSQAPYPVAVDELSPQVFSAVLDDALAG